MAVILVPKEGNDLVVNWWSWRPTVALLGRLGVLPAGERTERCLANGCGGHLSEQEALLAANEVDRLLEDLSPGERVLLDGSVSTEELAIASWDIPVEEFMVWKAENSKR